MTSDQIKLLEDKIEAWRDISRTGAFDLRDYYRRCAEALEACLKAAMENEQ